MGIKTITKHWGDKEEEEDSSLGDNKKSGSIVEESDANNIYFYSMVDRENVLRLNQSLYNKANELKLLANKFKIDPPPIFLHINSFGGSLFDCFAAMDTIKGLDVPVYSVVEGGAASAATLISVVCHKRIIRPSSFMLIHQLSSINWGKYEELKDDMQNNEKLMEVIYNTYEEYTKLPRKKIEGILKRDLWFDSKECLKFGLVDEIGHN